MIGGPGYTFERYDWSRFLPPKPGSFRDKGPTEAEQQASQKRREKNKVARAARKRNRK